MTIVDPEKCSFWKWCFSAGHYIDFLERGLWRSSITLHISPSTLMNLLEHSWTFVNGSSSQFVNCIHKLFIKNSSWQIMNINPFKPEFTIVIFSPLQAANCFRNSRLVVDEADLKRVKNSRKLPCISKPLSWKFSFQGLSCREIKSVFRDVKWCFNASWGLKGLMNT